jgi:hypothetical protein
MQLFGDSDILSFFRISQLNCVGHVHGMDSKRKVKYAIIIPREVQEPNVIYYPIHNGMMSPKMVDFFIPLKWWNCAQTDINRCKIKTGHRSKKKQG